MKHAELALFQSKSIPPAPSAVDFSGHWVNELGSHMIIAINGNKVSGSYVSAVSDNGGATQPFDLQGTVIEDLISFTVNWGAAITTWIGHGVIEQDQPKILTLWHLIMTIPKETDPETQWKTIMSGADNFTR